MVCKGPQFIDYRAEGGWRLSHLEGRQPDEKGKLNLNKVEVGVQPSNFLSLNDTAQRVKLGLEVIERQDLGWRTAEVDPQDLAKTHIHLQFHWMPRNITSQPTNPIHLDNKTDPEKQLSSQLNQSYGSKPIVCGKDNCETYQGTSGVAGHNTHSGRPIQTGDISTVIRNTNDVNFFHRIIDIQWGIICVAAISGAALAPEMLGHLPDEHSMVSVSFLRLASES